MFLASIGMASANPSTDTFGSDEPNPVVASPQQAKHSIKGVVEDALGPIAGANVVEKGTTNGTITDMDGNFSLEVSPNSILVVSYIGYKDQERKPFDESHLQWEKIHLGTFRMPIENEQGKV